MKRIELKTLGPEPTIDYKTILIEVVRRPLNPRDGIGIEEMRASIKVLDAIDASNGTLELEDADYQTLRQKLDAMKWNLVDSRILRLVEDVTNA